MLVFIMILAAVYSTLARNLNVGTVLFSAKDLDKFVWTYKEISLLKAREYFQTVLPPETLLKTLNDTNINVLLEYFRDMYTNVKRRSTDYESDTIMTTALTDVIGGYLKAYVLPIAKLNFYAGTVSSRQIMKLYQFYDEIKKYLNTDGRGWHYANNKIMPNLVMNVNYPKFSLRGIPVKDPCDLLAYLENDPNSFSIPMPKIKWDAERSTLFVPLQNVSLVSMNDPNHEKILVRYNDVAKCCLAIKNPSDMKIFYKHFETWLLTEVIPHLNDDHLYLALDSVLTLMNGTRSLAHSLSSLYMVNQNGDLAMYSVPIELSSKKMILILIILFFEIAWCIPVLIYVIFKKDKKPTGSCAELKSFYLFTDPSNSDEMKDRFSSKRNRSTTTVYSKPHILYFKPFKNTETQYSIESIHPSQNKDNNLHSETQCTKLLAESWTGSRSYLKCKNQYCETDVDYYYSPRKSSMEMIAQNPELTTNEKEVPTNTINWNLLGSMRFQPKEAYVAPKDYNRKDSPAPTRNRSDYNKSSKNTPSKKKQGKEMKKQQQTNKRKHHVKDTKDVKNEPPKILSTETKSHEQTKVKSKIEKESKSLKLMGLETHEKPKSSEACKRYVFDQGVTDPTCYQMIKKSIPKVTGSQTTTTMYNTAKSSESQLVKSAQYTTNQSLEYFKTEYNTVKPTECKALKSVASNITQLSDYLTSQTSEYNTFSESVTSKQTKFETTLSIELPEIKLDIPKPRAQPPVEVKDDAALLSDSPELKSSDYDASRSQTSVDAKCHKITLQDPQTSKKAESKSVTEPSSSLSKIPEYCTVKPTGSRASRKSSFDMPQPSHSFVLNSVESTESETLKVVQSDIAQTSCSLISKTLDNNTMTTNFEYIQSDSFITEVLDDITEFRELMREPLGNTNPYVLPVQSLEADIVFKNLTFEESITDTDLNDDIQIAQMATINEILMEDITEFDLISDEKPPSDIIQTVDIIEMSINNEKKDLAKSVTRHRSKIPKPNFQSTHKVERPPAAINVTKHRSLIPQRKKKAEDDTALSRSCTSRPLEKLNLSF